MNHIVFWGKITGFEMKAIYMQNTRISGAVGREISLLVQKTNSRIKSVDSKICLKGCTLSPISPGRGKCLYLKGKYYWGGPMFHFDDFGKCSISCAMVRMGFRHPTMGHLTAVLVSELKSDPSRSTG